MKTCLRKHLGSGRNVGLFVKFAFSQMGQRPFVLFGSVTVIRLLSCSSVRLALKYSYDLRLGPPVSGFCDKFQAATPSRALLT